MQKLNASFIVPVNDTAQFEKLKSNLEKRFTNYEVLPVHNAKSFFDAWKRGLANASKKYLVLTHQDVQFYNFPNLNKVFVNKVGMVGPSGSKIITKSWPWFHNYFRWVTGKLSGEVHRDFLGLKFKETLGKYGKVVVLDGQCLVTPKTILKEVEVPNVSWANWNFYDHVLSLNYLRKGYQLKTVPIKMLHYSLGFGAFSQEFKKSRKMFQRNYFKNKDTYEVE